ncbi:MAG: hypothetical protein HRU36_03030 [Rickettsiales bacterium]|nr:hypothetical protein [Rickettsiales bacterium]
MLDVKKRCAIELEKIKKEKNIIKLSWSCMDELRKALCESKCKSLRLEITEDHCCSNLPQLCDIIKNSELTFLGMCLPSVHISGVQVKNLAQAIKGSKLKSLILSCSLNDITDAGVKELKEAFKVLEFLGLHLSSPYLASDQRKLLHMLSDADIRSFILLPSDRTREEDCPERRSKIDTLRKCSRSDIRCSIKDLHEQVERGEKKFSDIKSFIDVQFVDKKLKKSDFNKITGGIYSEGDLSIDSAYGKFLREVIPIWYLTNIGDVACTDVMMKSNKNRGFDVTLYDGNKVTNIEVTTAQHGFQECLRREIANEERTRINRRYSDPFGYCYTNGKKEKQRIKYIEEGCRAHDVYVKSAMVSMYIMYAFYDKMMNPKPESTGIILVIYVTATEVYATNIKTICSNSMVKNNIFKQIYCVAHNGDVEMINVYKSHKVKST